MNKGITIAGGGLTGLSLGIALRKHNVPVILHEAGSYPRHRVCGEFICGVQQSTLRNLEIESAFEQSAISENCAWFDKQNVIHSANLPMKAYGVSRYAMDLHLSNLFSSLGGELHLHSRLPDVGEEGLVWAAGRKPQKSEWIGLKCHLYHFKAEADLEMHMGEGGYVGIAPVEDGKWNVCGLFRIRPAVKAPKDKLLIAYLNACGLNELALRLERFEADADSYAAVAGFSLGKQAERLDLFCLGDASAMIPPFTGNGMSMAFESAEIALSPLLEYSAGRENWERTSEIVRERLDLHFHQRMQTAMAMHPFLLSSVGQKVTTFAARLGALPFQTLFKRLR